MLRAIIFDFDGVIVNSEPLKWKLINQIAAREGWCVTEDEYYRDYLQLDEPNIIEYLYRSHGKFITLARRDELLDWKRRAYAHAIADGLPALKGAVEFVRQTALHFTLAIASGSLRSEIEPLLRRLEIHELFAVVTAADDCERPKPDPEVFLKTLTHLQRLPAFRLKPLDATECLAIEDAPHGVVAAHKAGIRCLALASSLAPEKLRGADWVCSSFEEVDLSGIESVFQ